MKTAYVLLDRDGEPVGVTRDFETAADLAQCTVLAYRTIEVRDYDAPEPVDTWRSIITDGK